MFKSPKSVQSFSPVDHHYFFSDKVNNHRNTPEFVSVHSPLGRSTTMNHYDKPVPGYVTEYMASYKRPPLNAYCNTPVKLLNNDFDNGQEHSEISNIGDYESVLTLPEQTELETKLHQALEILGKHRIDNVQSENDENDNDLDNDMKRVKRKQQRNKKEQIELTKHAIKSDGSDRPFKIDTNV